MSAPFEVAKDWPKGDFIMEVKVYDEVDKNAANVKIYATVKARGRAEM